MARPLGPWTVAPYIASWDDFLDKSTKLFLEAPSRTRYSIKYRHTDCQMVLKVTDDVTCLKFGTDQANCMARVGKLSKLFVRLMASTDLASEPTAIESGPKQVIEIRKRKSKSCKK